MDITYKILEITTSYREEIVPNELDSEGNSPTTSTVNCYLVAHCLYEYGLMNKLGSVDNDIYIIATKEYDESGNFTLTPGTGNYPTYEQVEEGLKSIIEAQILTDYNEETYKALIRQATGVAETTINRYYRDNPVGLPISNQDNSNT